MRLRTASAAFLPSRCYMQPTLFYFIFFSSIRYDKKAELFVTVAVAHMSMISEPNVSEWASLRYVATIIKAELFVTVAVAHMQVISEPKVSEWASLRYVATIIKAELFVTSAVAHMPMISKPKVSEWASLRYVLYKLKSSVFNEALSNKFISKKQKISALKSCYEFEPACVSGCM
jgi:hypothetical protein